MQRGAARRAQRPAPKQQHHSKVNQEGRGAALLVPTDPTTRLAVGVRQLHVRVQEIVQDVVQPRDEVILRVVDDRDVPAALHGCKKNAACGRPGGRRRRRTRRRRASEAAARRRSRGAREAGPAAAARLAAAAGRGGVAPPNTT